MKSNTHNNKRERYYHREAVKSIGLDNTTISFGAEKTCHIFKNVVVFNTPLENLNNINADTLIVQKLLRFFNTQQLINAGVQTPKILDIQIENNTICEIQERATGKVLSYTNESNILKTFNESSFVSIKDIPEIRRSEFIKQVLTYNANMQKQLKNAPITHYVKFIKDFKYIQEYGLDLDIHGENFLYDTEKGFSFIDLPFIQSTDEKLFTYENIHEQPISFSYKKTKEVKRFRKVSDFTIVMQICSLFVDFLKYSGFSFDVTLVKQMKKNNFAIIENKIIPSIQQLHFNLTETEWLKIQSYVEKFTNKKLNLSTSVQP